MILQMFFFPTFQQLIYWVTSKKYLVDLLALDTADITKPDRQNSEKLPHLLVNHRKF